MSILTNNLVLTLQAITGNSPLLCYKNIVNYTNIVATSAASGFPATNMSNPATSFYWLASSTADQTITITNTNRVEIDYIGIARHNLSQAGLDVRVRFDGTTVFDYAPISDEQALLFLFEVASPLTIEIDIRGATSPVRMSVVYVGQSTLLQRSIYVGHTPINYGRDRTYISGVSQSGEFLGEIVTNETLSTSVSLQNLTPDWYRSTLDPFISRKPRAPCFFAWRPTTYSDEVSYCWVEGNPRPVNQRANGMMSIDFNLRGIA